MFAFLKPQRLHSLWNHFIVQIKFMTEVLSRMLSLLQIYL